MELVEKFIKLISGLINHVRENIPLKKISEFDTPTTQAPVQAPVVTTYLSYSEFVGEFFEKNDNLRRNIDNESKISRLQKREHTVKVH